MKKLYIYILIGLVCFLGFNGDVQAEYKAICKYKYSDTYNSNSSSRKIVDAELLYDANQSKPYKLTVTLTAEKIDYDNEEENFVGRSHIINSAACNKLPGVDDKAVE